MGCSVKSMLAQAPRMPISVNGIVIPHDAIAREMQYHPDSVPARSWQQAARALVVRELLLQEARRRGLKPEPLTDGEGRRETDEEALIRGLIEREVKPPAPDEDVCRRFYDDNPGRFRSSDLYEAAHILIAARRNEPDAFAAAREKAEQLLALLRQEPDRFAELAAAHSDCPSASAGGNLGQITAGDTTPEFEQALASLEPGEMTGAPAETRYGFHIIRLNRRIPGRVLPFVAVRARITGYLAERSYRAAIAQFVARLAEQAEIKGLDLAQASPARPRITPAIFPSIIPAR